MLEYKMYQDGKQRFKFMLYWYKQLLNEKLKFKAVKSEGRKFFITMTKKYNH